MSDPVPYLELPRPSSTSRIPDLCQLARWPTHPWMTRPLKKRLWATTYAPLGGDPVPPGTRPPSRRRPSSGIPTWGWRCIEHADQGPSDTPTTSGTATQTSEDRDGSAGSPAKPLWTIVRESIN
jgi:hypothetical protein